MGENCQGLSRQQMFEMRGGVYECLFDLYRIQVKSASESKSWRIRRKYSKMIKGIQKILEEMASKAQKYKWEGPLES